LNSGTDDSDLVVMIGSGICNVTSLSRNQLTCKPPGSKPPDIDENGWEDRSKAPSVKVSLIYYCIRIKVMISW